MRKSMKKFSPCKGINCALKDKCQRFNSSAKIDVIGSPWFSNKEKEVLCLEYLGGEDD